MKNVYSRESLGKAKDGEQVVLRKQFVVDAVEKVEGEDKAGMSSARVRRFVISTAGVDRDNDTIAAGGWQLDNYRKNPVVLWAHDYTCLPVAKAIQVGVENDQLVATAEFADHDFANAVLRLLDGGFLRATSVGFRPISYSINEERRGYDFQTQELLEFSVVPVPANAEALALAGLADGDAALLKGWADNVIKALAPKSDDPEPTPEPESTPDPVALAATIVEAVKSHLDGLHGAPCAACAAADKAAGKSGRVLSRANESSVRSAVDHMGQANALLTGVLQQLNEQADDDKAFGGGDDPDVLLLDDEEKAEDDFQIDPKDAQQIIADLLIQELGAVVRETTESTLARMRGRVD